MSAEPIVKFPSPSGHYTADACAVDEVCPFSESLFSPVDIKDACQLDIFVPLFDFRLRAHMQHELGFDIQPIGAGGTARGVRLESDQGYIFQGMCRTDLLQEHFVCVRYFIDGGIGDKDHRSSVPGKRVDPRVGPLVRLQFALVLIDVVELIPVRTASEDHPVALVQAVLLDVFQYSGPAK
jgi:hypothetical protein